MKLALAYSTKDQVKLSEQTFPVLRDGQHALFWCDGSQTEAGLEFFRNNAPCTTVHGPGIKGGPDAAIAWKLSKMLAAPQKYTHIGLIENDVLLDLDWLEPTMALFEKGKQDGLEVGAVSPRSYVDRILIQRDGWAVMHNLGAGVVIFTRAAADLILRSFRTTWWPDNVRLFASLSGIDLRTYAAFRGQEQWCTTDWGWETMLARHGLASLALTPAKCQMIGQVPSLEKQGLELTSETLMQRGIDQKAFEIYRDNLASIRAGVHKLDGPNIIHREHGGMLFFPHQLGHLAGTQWAGNLVLKNSQGFGPFAYVAGHGGASLSLRISGSCSYLATGGVDGARVTVTDARSDFKSDPDLPAGDEPIISITVPGTPIPRILTFDMAEGAVFHGLQTTDPQMLDTTFRFNWDQLPAAEG